MKAKPRAMESVAVAQAMWRCQTGLAAERNGDGQGGGAAFAPGGGDLLEAGEGRAGEGNALGAEGAGGEVGGECGGRGRR